MSRPPYNVWWPGRWLVEAADGSGEAVGLLAEAVDVVAEAVDVVAEAGGHLPPLGGPLPPLGGPLPAQHTKYAASRTGPGGDGVPPAYPLGDPGWRVPPVTDFHRWPCRIAAAATILRGDTGVRADP